jgi:hypothetical protein
MRVNVNHWMGNQQLAGTDIEPGPQELTPEQICALYERWDVMLTGLTQYSEGALLWLDEKAKGFKQR